MHTLLRAIRDASLLAALIIALSCVAHAADIAQDDVLLKVEVENWGAVRGMQPVTHEEASGGVAMSMAEDALAVGGLQMPAGDYTLVLWQMAPAGDADGFFVEINGERTRLLGTIGRWGTLTLPFSVRRAGPVTIAIIGQEPTMTVDTIAVVRGTYQRDQIAFADIPGEVTGESVGLQDIARLAIPCALAEPPSEPLPADEHTVYQQDFEARCAGVSGEHRWTDGPFGRALILDMPDGRFDIDASALEIAEQGTVEWWVKPREAARVWWDQGWHYFLHAEPAQPGGTQLDLFTLRANLALRTTQDATAYALSEGTHENVQFSVGRVDLTQWHHMLVSWDLRGDRQYLWVMVDGHGMQSFFPRTFEAGEFSRIELGNTPSDWDVPYLPMDGAIDAIRISNVSVQARLAD